MKETDAIPMTEVKEKLANLEQYLPGQQKTTYDFARYLATTLSGRLAPAGFNLKFQFALADAQVGINGLTHEPVPSEISDLPSIIYTVLEMQMPAIAKAVCPDEFAKKVNEVYGKTHK
jgi:hypothetical protein